MSRQVTYPFDFAVSWYRVKTKTFYLHFDKTFNHQTWQSGGLGSTFSSKLVWGPYINSIAKTAYKKIGALNRSTRFLSPEVALYLHKSTIRHCMKCCSQIWACAPGCCLELLAKLQKHICKTVGPSLATFLEPLAHRRNVASLSLFYSYYTLVDVHLNWLNWFHFRMFERSTCYSDSLHDFSVTIPRCYKDVVNSFFSGTARLGNYLECLECLDMKL